MIELYHGDFLEKAKNIPDDSVDLVLTDPPYGTVKGLRLECQKENVYGWDEAIEPKALFAEINRILRKNGKAVLFGQEPFTSRMITETIPNLPFSYRMIWEKDHFANGLGAKKAPVNYYEDVMVFSKTHPTSDFENGHPLRAYFTGVLNYIGLKKSEINKIIGQRATNVFRVDSTQFALCTERTYDDLIKEFGIDEMANFQEYNHLKKVDERYKRSVASTFNLWQKKKTKSNILKYAKDYPSLHPTQKPVLLLEDLVKTFSNEGDLVVDLTMGSGSTGVACKNTGRRFIGIEMDDEYFNIAKERIETHEQQLELV